MDCSIDILSRPRRATGWEDEFGMHTVSKHGPEVPDAALKQRAIDGTNPADGKTHKKSFPQKSSQFNSWKLQMHAINEALTREARGLPLSNGTDTKGNKVLRIEQPGAGRSYKPNKSDPSNPTLNNNMNGVEIKLSKTTGKPFTAFPTEGD